MVSWEFFLRGLKIMQMYSYDSCVVNLCMPWMSVGLVYGVVMVAVGPWCVEAGGGHFKTVVLVDSI